MCPDAISNVLMKVNNSIQNNGSFKRMSPNSGNANITLSDLQQNEQYSANLTIEYNGGVVQESQPVEISKWCTNMHVTVSIFDFENFQKHLMLMMLKWRAGEEELCVLISNMCLVVTKAVLLSLTAQLEGNISEM